MAKSLIHYVRHLMGLDKAATQLSEREKVAISDLAQTANHILEIGIFEGGTTRLLITNAPAQAHVQAIDPFTAGRIGICWGKLIADREIDKGKTANPSVKVTIHRAFSQDVKIDHQLDLIFVDGDHSLAGITRDWADWSPRVAPGGVIALHDSVTPSHNPNVASLGSCQYYASHIAHDPAFELIEIVDSMAILRKK